MILKSARKADNDRPQVALEKIHMLVISMDMGLTRFKSPGYWIIPLTHGSLDQSKALFCSKPYSFGFFFIKKVDLIMCFLQKQFEIKLDIA